MPLQPQATQAVFYHIMDNPVRREQLRGGGNVLFADFDVLFQVSEHLVLRLGVVILVQPANYLHLILPVVLRNQRDHLLNHAALAQQIIRQKKLGIVLNLLEHAGQNAIQGVALNNEQVLEKFLFLIAVLHLVDFGLVEAVQIQVNRLGENLRAEAPLVIRKNADVRGQISVNLHETQGGNAVEPGVGNFFHHLLVAFFLDAANQRLPLPLLGVGKQMPVHAVGVRVAQIVLAHAEHGGALGHAVDQLPPRPYRVFLDCIFVHCKSPFSEYR